MVLQSYHVLHCIVSYFTFQAAQHSDHIPHLWHSDGNVCDNVADVRLSGYGHDKAENIPRLQVCRRNITFPVDVVRCQHDHVARDVAVRQHLDDVADLRQHLNNMTRLNNDSYPLHST